MCLHLRGLPMDLNVTGNNRSRFRLWSQRGPLTALGTLAFLLISGCSSTKVSDKSKDLARSLEKASLEKSLPNKSRQSTPVRARVYLDGSLSMSGYVSGQPGRRTVFDNFIDKLGDYLPGCG